MVLKPKELRHLNTFEDLDFSALLRSVIRAPELRLLVTVLLVLCDLC